MMGVDEVVDGGILLRNAGGEDGKDANGVVAISLGRDGMVGRAYGMFCAGVKYMMFEGKFVVNMLRKYFGDDRGGYVDMMLDFGMGILSGRIALDVAEVYIVELVSVPSWEGEYVLLRRVRML
jgi:hypothetical protein